MSRAGKKKKTETPTGLEPMRFRTPLGWANHLAARRLVASWANYWHASCILLGSTMSFERVLQFGHKIEKEWKILTSVMKWENVIFIMSFIVCLSLLLLFLLLLLLLSLLLLSLLLLLLLLFMLLLLLLLLLLLALLLLLLLLSLLLSLLLLLFLIPLLLLLLFFSCCFVVNPVLIFHVCSLMFYHHLFSVLLV